MNKKLEQIHEIWLFANIYSEKLFMIMTLTIYFKIIEVGKTTLITNNN